MFVWLLILIAYLPFEIALNPLPGIDLASIRLFVVIFFIIWFFKSFFRKELSLKSFFGNFQAIGLSLFLLFTFLSLFGSENISWGVRKIMYFLSLFPLYFLIVALVNRWEKIKKVILILILSGGGIAFLGLGQFFSSFVFGLDATQIFWAKNILPVFSGFNLGSLILSYPSWLVNINGEVILRAFSRFSDPHMFSFYLGLIFPIAVAFSLTLPKKKKTYTLFLSFIIYISCLLSFSRGAYLAIIITTLILVLFLFKYLKQRKISLILLFSLLIFLIPLTPISERFYSSFSLEDNSNLGRLEMWKLASQQGIDNFWNGVGLGNYSLLVDSTLGYRNPATAHNLYLDIFSEIGFFGLAIWLLLILGTFWQLLKMFKQKEDFTERVLIVGLLGSLSYLLIHSFFETFIYQPIILGVLMIILGFSSRIIMLTKE